MGAIVIKIMWFVFLLFLVCLTETFSQESKTSILYSDGFNWVANKNARSIITDENKLSLLHNLNDNYYLASLKTYSDVFFITNSKSSVNHHPLVFAKINFFGVNNLEKKEDAETPFKEDDSSFWDNEIVYFVIGAVAATALYIVWQNSGSENPPQKTFGLPPKPKSVYEL